MKLYYVIDVVEFRVVSIHRSKDAADKAVDSQRHLEVHVSNDEETFLVYTFYEPNTSSQPDVHFTDVLSEDLCKFSFVKPDYHSTAVEALNHRLNRMIKEYGIIEMNHTLSFMDAIESLKDQYSKSSTEPELKGQPFTHYSVVRNGWGDPSIAYHVVIDVSNC